MEDIDGFWDLNDHNTPATNRSSISTATRRSSTAGDSVVDEDESFNFNYDTASSISG